MKKVISAVLLAFLIMPAAMFAKHTDTHVSGKPEEKVRVEAKLDTKNNEMAQSLLEDIKKIKAERKTKMATILTTLKRGSKGEAVRTLQTLLALDPTIYPEGIVNGTYGPLTAKAVMKFQKSKGLTTPGVVGPATLEELKKLAEENDLTAEDGVNGKLCAIVPPGHLIAKGYLKRNVRPEIPTCQIIPAGIAKKLKDIVPLPDPTDKTAPVISAVASSNIAATTAKITWTTDELSKSSIWYGTANPVVTTGAATATDSSFTTAHTLNLTGLTASTVYYYTVGSVDASGNASVSAQGTFTTLTPDTTDPVQSALTVSEITATGAKVTWTTDELTTNKIWVSTTNPVVTSGTATMANPILVTSPSFTLTALTANTAYYYIVESIDASNNNTVSAQGTFTTLAI